MDVKPKVCLCFFGLPRCLELSYVFTKHYLIEPLNADVFIHTWDINNGGYRFKVDDSLVITSNRFISNEYKSNKPSYPVFSASTVEEYIKNDISPKFYNIENYNNFSKIYGNESTQSMYYSIKNVNALKKSYEEIHNFKYDMAIMCRMDTLFKTKIPNIEIQDCLEGNIYMSANRTPDSYNFVVDDMLCDMFIFGRNDLIDKYSKSFDTWLNNKSLKSEFVHYNHLNKIGIKPKMSNMKLFLMEFFSDNEWYAIYHTKK